jgi:hypothetical protein
MNAQLEQAQFVETFVGTPVRRLAWRHRFDSEIVGDQHRQPTLVDPPQQMIIASIEMAEGVFQQRFRRIGARLQQRRGLSRVQTHHVAALDDRAGCFGCAHQVVVAHQPAVSA